MNLYQSERCMQSYKGPPKLQWCRLHIDIYSLAKSKKKNSLNFRFVSKPNIRCSTSSNFLNATWAKKLDLSISNGPPSFWNFRHDNGKNPFPALKCRPRQISKHIEMHEVFEVTGPSYRGLILLDSDLVSQKYVCLDIYYSSIVSFLQSQTELRESGYVPS